MMTSENYADALDAAATAKLARALRAVFPHDGLPEAPYLRSAEAIVANVSGSTHVGTDLLSGILRHLEQTEFFQIMLTSAVVTLYSDHEVWDYLGYEGFSSEQGGYISRGFDDLSWLPEPRILEYVGDEQLVEYVPAVPGVQISFDNTKKVATI
jgi:hypothetical protein